MFNTTYKVANKKRKWNKMNAIKKPAKRTDGGNPLIDRLLKLKYRINDAYRDKGMDTKSDKHWVMNLITDVRTQDWTNLSKEDMLKCNGLWRKYEG